MELWEDLVSCISCVSPQKENWQRMKLPMLPQLNEKLNEWLYWMKEMRRNESIKGMKLWNERGLNPGIIIQFQRWLIRAVDKSERDLHGNLSVNAVTMFMKKHRRARGEQKLSLARRINVWIFITDSSVARYVSRWQSIIHLWFFYFLFSSQIRGFLLRGRLD